LLSGTGV